MSPTPLSRVGSTDMYSSSHSLKPRQAAAASSAIFESVDCEQDKSPEDHSHIDSLVVHVAEPLNRVFFPGPASRVDGVRIGTTRARVTARGAQHDVVFPHDSSVVLNRSLVGELGRHPVAELAPGLIAVTIGIDHQANGSTPFIRVAALLGRYRRHLAPSRQASVDCPGSM